MLTGSDLKNIANKLKQDEEFCRLAYYGNEPFGEFRDDIVGTENHKEIMDKIIRYAPQLPDVDPNEESRINIFKHYTKLKSEVDFVRYESIQIDLFVPHRIMNEELRVYGLENKICDLIEGMEVGIGKLDYVDGRFITITNVSGYVQFTMIFTTEDTRRLSNYYGKR
jgi:hypothetical protein